MKPEQHSVSRHAVAGRVVTLTTYKLGDEWHCTADNTDPGARLGRCKGTSKEAVEKAALETAEALLTGRKVAPPTACSAG
jgi:hypothetical protein